MNIINHSEWLEVGIRGIKFNLIQMNNPCNYNYFLSPNKVKIVSRLQWNLQSTIKLVPVKTNKIKSKSDGKSKSKFATNYSGMNNPSNYYYFLISVITFFHPKRTQWRKNNSKGRKKKRYKEKVLTMFLNI